MKACGGGNTWKRKNTGLKGLGQKHARLLRTEAKGAEPAQSKKTREKQGKGYTRKYKESRRRNFQGVRAGGSSAGCEETASHVGLGIGKAVWKTHGCAHGTKHTDAWASSSLPAHTADRRSNVCQAKTVKEHLDCMLL